MLGMRYEHRYDGPPPRIPARPTLPPRIRASRRLVPSPPLPPLATLTPGPSSITRSRFHLSCPSQRRSGDWTVGGATGTGAPLEMLKSCVFVSVGRSQSASPARSAALRGTTTGHAFRLMPCDHVSRMICERTSELPMLPPRAKCKIPRAPCSVALERLDPLADSTDSFTVR